MKTGLKLLTSCAIMLTLTSCGEEEIVYEESLYPVVETYLIPSGDTAPAFYSDVLTYTKENTGVLEGDEEEAEAEAAEGEEEAEPVELSKAEQKEADAEAKRLEAAREILLAEQTREFNKLNSVRIVSMQDPTETNATAVAEAEAEHLLAIGGEEGATAENLSSTEGEEDLSYLEDVELLPFVYTYDVSTTGSTGGEATASYVAHMQSSGFKIIDPFHPVENEYYEMLDPDFTQRSGTLALAKKASGDQKIFMIIVDWNPVGAVVTVYEEEGTLWIPPKKDSTAAKSSLSVSDAVNFFETRTPDSLGLDGNDMSEFSVYSSEAIVIMNGVSYRQFTITKNPVDGGGSAFGGTYLMDSEGNTLVLDRVTGTVSPLQVPNVYDTLN